MNSDEDEDVIFEGSELYSHLVNSAYDGPEIEFYSSGKHSQDTKIFEEKNCQPSKNGVWSSNLINWKRKLGFVVVDHVEEFNQRIITLIWSSSLVLVEDVDFITNMFDEMLASSIIKPCGQTSFLTLLALGGAALTATLFSTAVFPWVLRLPSLIFSGITAARVIDKGLQDRNHSKFQTVVTSFEATLSCLQNFCTNLGKVLQFIQEMELIDRGFTLPNLVSHLSIKTRPGHTSALLCSPLRNEVINILQEFYSLVRKETVAIRERIPLNSAVDNPSHYFACSEIPNKLFEHGELVSLQALRNALRQCHIQLSEMLRRLALCFLVPSHQRHIDLVKELSHYLPNCIEPLNERLQLAYKYYSSWKVSDHSTSHLSSSTIPDDANPRTASLDLALHSLERHLCATSLLIDSIRTEENKLGLRSQLSHECKAIGTCWELVEMEFIKSSKPAQTTSHANQEVAPLVRDTGPAEKGEALPLYGPWEPDVQDLEILEADLEKEPAQRFAQNDDDDFFLTRETREERLARKREMAAQSKRLYSELQVVLKSKADEWKEREARVMERLGKPAEQAAIETVPEETPANANCEQDEQEDIPIPIEQPTRSEPKFDMTSVPASNFSLQASLAAQVRALASQRTVQQEDLIGDSDDADSNGSYEDY